MLEEQATDLSRDVQAQRSAICVCSPSINYGTRSAATLTISANPQFFGPVYELMHALKDQQQQQFIDTRSNFLDCVFTY
jgi:hypothetical protein